jgi:hypothetical protein
MISGTSSSRFRHEFETLSATNPERWAAETGSTTCAPVITMNMTAPHGFVCSGLRLDLSG